MMMSLSFFWETEQILDSLVQTINNNLKDGGNFLFITIDGDVVSEMFRPTFLKQSEIIQNDTLILGDLVTVKYLADNYINIDIKDSLVQNQDEWLVHLSDLSNKFSKYNISLNYKKRAIDQNFLSENEHIFTSLYSYGTFSKNFVNIKNNLTENKMAGYGIDIDTELINEIRETERSIAEGIDFR